MGEDSIDVYGRQLARAIECFEVEAQLATDPADAARAYRLACDGADRLNSVAVEMLARHDPQDAG